VPVSVSVGIEAVLAACFEEWTSAPTCNGQRYNVIESPLLPANEFVY
jgi:hypothetical protein